MSLAQTNTDLDQALDELDVMGKAYLQLALENATLKQQQGDQTFQVDDWLRAIERQLEIAQCDDKEKVLYAFGQLQGATLD